MNHIYDSIIIGGGPAGYTAAMYAARAGLDVLVIERMSVGGQMALTADIDNYPGFDEGIDGFTLGTRMQNGAERFGAKTEYAEVLSVELSDKIKKIETDSGSFLAKTVIIATGANPRRLGIEGEDRLTGRGVHYCAHCDGRFYRDMTVAVVGGGNSAVSDALLLSRLAKKVYLIHRRDSLRATKIYREALMKAENVEIIWNSKITEFVADDRLSAIRIADIGDKNAREIPANAVFVSIGRSPATDIFRNELDIDRGGYIIADESTRTNIPGVYAAGDVRTKELRQVVTATADGAVAASMAEEYISSEF